MRKGEKNEMKKGVLLLLRGTVQFCQMPGWELETRLSAKQLIRAHCQDLFFFFFLMFSPNGKKMFHHVE